MFRYCLDHKFTYFQMSLSQWFGCFDDGSQIWHVDKFQLFWYIDGHRPMGRVSFWGGGGGGWWLKSLALNIFSIACPKIKWFCLNITCLFARKLLFE